MAYHPERIEVPVSDVIICGRPDGKGGIEQIVSISPEVVALSASKMSYNSLGNLVKNLSANINEEGERDSERGNKKLANGLYCVANYLDMASESLKGAWQICAKHMTKVTGGYIGN